MGNKSDTPLADLLLSPEEAARMAGRRGTQAAVLLALYGWPDEPGLIFTERRGGPRRAPGGGSFSRGRPGPPPPPPAGAGPRGGRGGGAPRPPPGGPPPGAPPR